MMKSVVANLLILRRACHDGGSEALLRSLFGSVPHVQDNLPLAILLLLPDAGVLAVVDDRLAVFVPGAELIVAVGVAKDRLRQRCRRRREPRSSGCPCCRGSPWSWRCFPFPEECVPRLGVRLRRRRSRTCILASLSRLLPS